MENKKVCPHCGSSFFIGTILRGCAIESVIDESGHSSLKVIKESSADNYELNILKCHNCKNDVTFDELVERVICKRCGGGFAPNSINENGLCEVCSAIKEREELANASKEDLIKMLLEAEKKANSVVPSNEKKMEKMNEAMESIAEKEDKKTTPVVSKRGRRPKVKLEENIDSENDSNKETNVTEEIDSSKETNNNEEHKESSVVSEEEVTKESESISSSQAPFPNVVDMNLNNQSNENPDFPIPHPVENESTESFVMFNEEEDQF